MIPPDSQLCSCAGLRPGGTGPIWCLSSIPRGGFGPRKFAQLRAIPRLVGRPLPQSCKFLEAMPIRQAVFLCDLDRIVRLPAGEMAGKSAFRPREGDEVDR